MSLLCRCPDSASTKRQMVYTTSKGYIMTKFEGLMIKLQANDRDELNFEDILLKVEKQL